MGVGARWRPNHPLRGKRSSSPTRLCSSTTTRLCSPSSTGLRSPSSAAGDRASPACPSSTCSGPDTLRQTSYCYDVSPLSAEYHYNPLHKCGWVRLGDRSCHFLLLRWSLLPLRLHTMLRR